MDQAAGTLFNFFKKTSHSKKLLGFESSPEEVIRQSIILLLSTDRGERKLHPEFGSQLRTFMFRRSSEALFSKIADHVYECIEAQEKRVRVDSVDVQRRNPKDAILDILIRYTIEGSGLKQSLQYPIRLME